MQFLVLLILICFVISILKPLTSSHAFWILLVISILIFIPLFIRHKIKERKEYYHFDDSAEKPASAPQRTTRISPQSSAAPKRNTGTTFSYTGRKIKGNYVFFDLETTGLYPHGDEIIQISAIKVSDSNVIGKFNQYVNPRQYISPKITQLTGISNATVANSPKIGSVLYDFDLFIEDYVLVAHNAASFDIQFLDEAYERVFGKSLPNNYIDTLRISRAIYPDMPNHKLKTLVQELGLNAINTHNAIDDANCVYQLFLAENQYIDNIDTFIIKPNMSETPVYQSPEFNEAGEPLIRRCDITISPVNDRIPLNAIQSNIGKGYDDGDDLFLKGNDLRKNGDFKTAITLFDEARHKGYCSLFLYEAYALAYQSIKDYDNEIDILDEGIERLKALNIGTYKLEARRDKVVQQWYKKQERLRKQEETQIRRQELEKQRLEKLKERQEKAEAKKITENLPKKEVKRAVLQLSDDMSVIKRFDSVAEAAREIGVDPKGIRSAAKGLQKRSGGFAWKYEDEK